MVSTQYILGKEEILKSLFIYLFIEVTYILSNN